MFFFLTLGRLCVVGCHDFVLYLPSKNPFSETLHCLCLNILFLRFHFQFLFFFLNIPMLRNFIKLFTLIKIYVLKNPKIIDSVPFSLLDFRQVTLLCCWASPNGHQLVIFTSKSSHQPLPFFNKLPLSPLISTISLGVEAVKPEHLPWISHLSCSSQLINHQTHSFPPS